MDKLPPSFFFLIYFICGIFLQRIGGDLIYFLAIFIFSLILIKEKYLFLTPLFLFFLFLGFFLSKSSIPEFSYFRGFKLEKVKGIVEEVEEREKIKEVIFRPLNEKEKILLTVDKNREINIGDIIYLEELKVFPVGRENIYKFWGEGIILFGNTKYFKVVGKKLSFLKLLRIRVKNYIKNILLLSKPEISSFLRAVILGESGIVSKKVKDLFINTGTIHILAISGLHITLLVSFLVFLINSKNLRFVISLFLFFYAFIVGNKPPVLRAVFMYFYSILAKNFIREEDIINSFFMVCLISLIFSPLNIFNISFQLSYLATLGLILTPSFKIPLIKKYYQDLWKSSFWLFIFLMPFNIYFFERVHILSLIGNLFSIPIFHLILFLSFLLILLNIFPFTSFLISIIEFLINILFSGLQFILINYKISLILSLILIIFPFILKNTRNELLGV
ncbi:MAG: ComEC/Rec2 family competence protein [Dictyoglomus sp.]|nr:ComEC/Rec2 family competence protein [Dictyoglomus sp.]MDW8187737.1 ComEC/Rec2 family competence protein [Dictyoglomus sp.]